MGHSISISKSKNKKQKIAFLQYFKKSENEKQKRDSTRILFLVLKLETKKWEATR